jgi:2,4-dienoyl-CoA reductase-like NADH-dependent reductase (Old Yellow Enzyme family)
MSGFPRVAALKTVEAFRARLAELGASLACDDTVLAAPESPLGQPLDVDGFTVGNRFVIHPMEGWDAEADGKPSDLVRRRWLNFGKSGAKWLWGGEAMAVVHEGRANPRQLIINEANEEPLKQILSDTVEAHRAEFETADDFLVGFQLTHSGRFCRPNQYKITEPRILYRHPVLDRKFGIDSDGAVMTDAEIRRLIDRFIAAARIAQRCGAHFVDVKHCHGYLGHEFLSAQTRPGEFGGSFDNRTRFLREIVSGIRAACPGLKIGVRLSAFDFTAYKPDPALSTPKKLGPGIPEDPDGVTKVDLAEGIRFLELCQSLGIRMINVSAGSPYYNPHIQRPALFPPSDGYQPPEDPLAGCVRQIDATAELKRLFPDLVLVGTAYTYLQDYLPHVAQAQVRAGRVDAVGLGRMVLSYPALPADVLRTGMMNHKAICRTFSDCTTGPRNGLRSGCFPLDPYYRTIPDYKELTRIKSGA